MAETEKAKIKDEFSNRFERLTRSKAYLDYCEQVYGYREYLLNMMDKEQIDFLLNNIPVSGEDIIMDLGCGPGSILNLLIRKYGCKGYGIDQLDRAIIERADTAFTYINDDIDKISAYDLKPTITLAVDSLYFGCELDLLFSRLSHIGHNRMYLFFSQYIFDEARVSKSILQDNNTIIAGALNRNNISYKTIDYSENEQHLYENSLKVLPEYEKAFEDEGNRDLYEQKLKEDMMGMELYRKKLAKRYLYIIDEV